jgi:aminoglycoside phosphotransferase (APT) family kinase protein
MQFYKDIPGSQHWNLVEPIDAGWSEDRKYVVHIDGRRRYLLRISDISLYERKQVEYAALCRLNECPILMSRPVSLGVCNQGQSVYTLLTWVEGAEAEHILPQLSPQQQYELGYQAGLALHSLHAYPAPPVQECWESRFNRKIDRKIRGYQACELKIAGAEAIIRYIEANRCLLQGRPQVLQHGDFHVGNLVITGDKKVGVIDFNRCDYGDPWEEFNRIVWCAQVSTHFASGRINGYFADDVPERFFRLMALYIGSNTLASIPWAIPFGAAEVETMLDQAQAVLAWYADFKTITPSWYISHGN